MSPSRSTPCVPEPTPTTSLPRPSAWRASAQRAVTSQGPCAPSTWCPARAGHSPGRDGAGPAVAAARVENGWASGGGLPSLAQALDSIDNLTIDPTDRSRFRVEVFSEALELVQGGGGDSTIRLGGHPASEPALRDGLESALRELAAITDDRDTKVTLVDRANGVRRWTLR